MASRIKSRTPRHGGRRRPALGRHPPAAPACARRTSEAGVGPARLSALSVLVFGGPQRLTDLARAEQVRPPTMTKVVTGLEAAGLARRTADPDDARAVRVEATARGHRLLVEGRRRRVERLARGLTTLLPEELDVLAHAAAVMERVAGRV